MQVDPIKPKLRPPGNKRLKLLKCELLLSNSAFTSNLRRYNMEFLEAYAHGRAFPAQL